MELPGILSLMEIGKKEWRREERDGWRVRGRKEGRKCTTRGRGGPDPIELRTSIRLKSLQSTEKITMITTAVVF